jgi:hypothetical protein
MSIKEHAKICGLEMGAQIKDLKGFRTPPDVLLLTKGGGGSEIVTFLRRAPCHTWRYPIGPEVLSPSAI